jgi:hypothetical protein
MVEPILRAKGMIKADAASRDTAPVQIVLPRLGPARGKDRGSSYLFT